MENYPVRQEGYWWLALELSKDELQNMYQLYPKGPNQRSDFFKRSEIIVGDDGEKTYKLLEMYNDKSAKSFCLAGRFKNKTRKVLTLGMPHCSEKPGSLIALQVENIT